MEIKVPKFYQGAMEVFPDSIKFLKPHSYERLNDKNRAYRFENFAVVTRTCQEGIEIVYEGEKIKSHGIIPHCDVNSANIAVMDIDKRIVAIELRNRGFIVK